MENEISKQVRYEKTVMVGDAHTSVVIEGTAEDIIKILQVINEESAENDSE